MYQVISIGSALVDIFIHSKNFKARPSQEGQLLCQLYGDKMEVESFNVYTGGGASNTAVGFSRLGLNTGIICETGRDRFSHLVMEDLTDEGVGTKLVIEEKKEQTGGSVILVGLDGGRTVMVHRGASSMIDPYDISSYWASQAQWIHLSSIAGRKETLKKVFHLVARNSELNLSWNPGKKELALLANRELLPEQVPAKVFIVNKMEWNMLDSVQADVLTKIEQVVITDGKKGGDAYFNGEHKLHFQALSKQTTDNTGAGDAFCTGYVTGQILGRRIEESVEMGAKNAASVVQYYGAKAGLLTPEQLNI